MNIEYPVKPFVFYTNGGTNRL